MRVWICYEEKLNFPNYRHPKNRDDIVKSATEDMTYILRALRRSSRVSASEWNSGDPAVQWLREGSGAGIARTLSPDEWRKVFAGRAGKIEYIRAESRSQISSAR